MQDKLISFLEQGGKVKNGSCLVLSSVSKHLFPDKLNAEEFSSQFFDAFKLLLKNTEPSECAFTEHGKSGNVYHLNVNTRNLIATRNHTNIFRGISNILFHHESFGELIQAACYRLMATDETFLCDSTSSKTSLSPATIKLNTLKEETLPTRICVEYLCKILERNIMLHFGTDNQIDKGLDNLKACKSYIFGNYPQRPAIHLMIHGSNIYSLVGAKNLNILYNKDTEPLPASSLQSSRSCWNYFDPSGINFGEFGEEMLVFFKMCDFFSDFGKEGCSHISEEHNNSAKKLSLTLTDKRYGLLEESDIKMNDVASDAPDTVATHFKVINTKKDNHCLFQSISYCLTGSFDISIPLRRAVSIEFKRRENMYLQAFKSSKCSMEQIMDKKNRLESLTRWGNEDSLAILSHIIGRKIVVFGSNSSQPTHFPMQTFTTYNLGHLPSSEYRPIFLLLNNYHFQSLIPKKFSQNLIPTVGSTQMLEMHREMNKTIFNEHSYTRGKPKTHQNVHEIDAMKISKSGCELTIASPSISVQSTQVFKPIEIENASQMVEPRHVRLFPNTQMQILEISEFDNKILECLGTRHHNFNQSELEMYTLYLNVIKRDVAYLQNSMSENFIRVFMQRCTYYAFWSKELTRLRPWYNDSATKKKALIKKAKQLQKIQEKEKGKYVTREFFRVAGLPDETINIYNAMIEKIMKESLGRGNKFSKLKVLLDSNAKEKNKCRQIPEYNSAGLRLTEILESDIFNGEDLHEMHVPQLITSSLLSKQPAICAPEKDNATVEGKKMLATCILNSRPTEDRNEEKHGLELDSVDFKNAYSGCSDVEFMTLADVISHLQLKTEPLMEECGNHPKPEHGYDSQEEMEEETYFDCLPLMDSSTAILDGGSTMYEEFEQNTLEELFFSTETLFIDEMTTADILEETDNRIKNDGSNISDSVNAENIDIQSHSQNSIVLVNDQEVHGSFIKLPQENFTITTSDQRTLVSSEQQDRESNENTIRPPNPILVNETKNVSCNAYYLL